MQEGNEPEDSLAAHDNVNEDNLNRRRRIMKIAGALMQLCPALGVGLLLSISAPTVAEALTNDDIAGTWETGEGNSFLSWTFQPNSANSGDMLIRNNMGFTRCNYELFDFIFIIVGNSCRHEGREHANKEDQWLVCLGNCPFSVPKEGRLYFYKDKGSKRISAEEARRISAEASRSGLNIRKDQFEGGVTETRTVIGDGFVKVR